MIAQIIPGYEQDRRHRPDAAGVPDRRPHVPRRRASRRRSGKAQFAVNPLPAVARRRESQLRLMTVRSEGQFNTVVYEEEDIYRGQERRDVILMNAQRHRAAGPDASTSA